jgi:hypothetical protein
VHAQDERYAYVVLQRGPRPQPKQAASIGRRLAGEDAANEEEAFQVAPRALRSSPRLRQQAESLQEALLGKFKL